MPNHITIVINAPEEVIAALVDQEAERVVDFNRLVPQPENIEKGDCSGKHAPGVVCWYEWNVKYWGTKWNAYGEEVRSPTELKFETAWSHPVPIIQALHNRFPSATIDVRFADEDLGQNLGHYRIVDGEVRPVEEFTAGSEKALDFAAQVSYGKSYAEVKAEWEDD